jgi:hypothetical protein
MSYIFDNQITFERNEQLDAFGRLRISSLQTYFDSPLKHHEEIYIWDTLTIGSGTWNYSFSQNLLDASVTGNGDRVLRQTKEYFQLQNGKSHFGFIGVVFGTTTTGVTKNTGVYDDDNGFMVRQSGDGSMSFVIRSSASGSVQESVIPQASWNIDTLDGNGPSGINVDFEKLQILAFDMSYSGNGSVRFGVMVENKMIIAHQSSAFNLYAVNNFTTPSLPISYEIESTSGASTLKQQSCCIMIEGNYEERGVQRSVNTGTTAKNVGSTLTPVLSIKLKSQYRKGVIHPESFNILQTSNNKTLYYAIYMYTSLTGASWSESQSGTNCIAEVDTSATAFSGGILVDSGYLPAKATTTISEKFNNILSLAGDIAGNTDILTIAIAGVGGSVPCFASLNYYEVY